MRYVERLLGDREYLTLVRELEQAEGKRRFCRHGLSHFLDVARISWILVLEQEMKDGAEESVDLPELKEQIYLTALLHDLGRLAELRQGIPHHQAGAELAEYFLTKLGYSGRKRQKILEAIQEHRGNKKLNHDFINIIKEADNRSRNCFFCQVQAECKWSRERQNQTILW